MYTCLLPTFSSPKENLSAPPATLCGGPARGGGGGGKTGRLSEFTVAGPPCVCVVDDYT